MPPSFTTRRALALAPLLGALLLTGCASSGDSVAPTRPPSASTRPSDTAAFEAQIAALERDYDARVGISVLDTGTDRTLEYRADERFGYASTIKVLAAATLLRTTTADERAERVHWTSDSMIAAGYSPVTSVNLASGLTLDQLAEAAVRESDNTALNLLLEKLGGPRALGAALRQIGDDTTDPVNIESALNEITSGSTADTTTPAAFTADLTGILSGDVLDDSERDILSEWMSANATGDALIRAGAPAGWVVADKSGGAGAIRNDVAMVTPPGRDPVFITVLTTRNDPSVDYDNELVSKAAAIAFTSLH